MIQDSVVNVDNKDNKDKYYSTYPRYPRYPQATTIIKQDLHIYLLLLRIYH